jgi:hypothetical protein
VLLVAAIFSRHAEARAWAIEQATETYGPIALRSPVFDFVETEFYAATMGLELKKEFVAFERLFDPALLAECKLRTNDWEQAYVKMYESQRSSKEPNDSEARELRPVNIDPGYLTQAKLVLATTKDRDHRIYLRDGIYAEVTLHFQNKSWQPRPWTYPNYLRSDYQQFFTQCRDYLRSRSRG